MNLSLVGRRLPLLLIAGVLASCAVAPPSERAGGMPAGEVWAARKLRLQGLQAWDCSGRISVTGPDGSWNARIHWVQRDAGYDIYFLSLFGQHIARLQGGGPAVVLQLADQEPLQAANPKELLESSFGWSAPVEDLRYWILGTPPPRADATPGLDASGRLVRLQQDGWEIEVPRYTRIGSAAGPLDLPKQLNLQGSGLRIRLVVDSWGLGE